MATPVLVNGITGTATGATFVRGASCKLLGFTAFNPSTGTAYLQMFDAIEKPVVGTTAPKWSVGIPTAQTVNLADLDLYFNLGLWVAATTTATGATGATTAMDASFEMS